MNGSCERLSGQSFEGSRKSSRSKLMERNHSFDPNDRSSFAHRKLCCLVQFGHDRFCSSSSTHALFYLRRASTYQNGGRALFRLLSHNSSDLQKIGILPVHKSLFVRTLQHSFVSQQTHRVLGRLHTLFSDHLFERVILDNAAISHLSN